MLLGLATDARSFVATIREKGLSPAIYLAGPEPEEFQSLAREGVDVGGIRFISAWDAIDPTLGVQHFKSAFANRYGEEPTYAAALAYDGAHILFWAIRNVIKDLPEDKKSDVGYIRKSLSEQLSKFRDEDLPADTLVLRADHEFTNQHEYRKIEFQGLQYDHQGQTISWDQTVPAYKRENAQLLGTVPVVLPKLLVFLAVWFFGMLGSITRQVYETSNRTLKGIFAIMLRPLSYLVDPVIAVIVFVTLFLVILITKQDLLKNLGVDVLYLSAVAIGFAAGFLGVRAQYALLARIGVSEEVVHPKSKRTQGSQG